MDKDNKADDKDRSQGAMDNSDHDSMAEGSDSKSVEASATTKADALAEREMRVLVMSRIVIGAILFFTAVGAALTTYFVTSREQVRDFETQFEDFAQEIVSVSNDVLSMAVTSMDAMSSTMIAFASSHQAQWPLYTLAEYELFGDNLRNMSGAQIIAWSPLVKGEEDRQLWETYTAEKTGSQEISSKIFSRSSGGQIVEDGNGPFSPVWQMASASSDASTINFNLLSDSVFDQAFVRATGTQGAVLSEVVDASKLFGAAAMAEVANPQSLLVTPVYNGFSPETGLPVLVGSVVAVLPWDIFFKDIIHEGIPPIYAVVNDGMCGNEFTYKINGPEALYLGQGKIPESDLDKHAMAFSFGEALTSYGREDGVNCMYTVTFYPVQVLKDQFLSLAPVIWTAIITAVFVFTTVIFCLYDYVVQARQRRVMDAAAKSNAIVSSLFPAEIRDRLFGNEAGDKDSKKVLSSLPESSKYRLKNYLADEEAPDDGKRQEGGPGNISRLPSEPLAPTTLDMYETKPIADLFPSTTVMFADIAGFTAWSSVREPSQVFTLLETVYRAFDAIAKRRRVFKVETVGDCYVAVTGLPEPRKDHAIAMTRFSRECLEKFNELAKQLEITLGPDTGDLAMRVGLHSGPVTAGVLRGDKSRFQLFGDTVNTAARVESTGQRNKVHLSHDTAELLIAAGKPHWIKKRAETVNAKGKGVMQTYWLIINSEGTGEPGEKQDTLQTDENQAGDTTNKTKHATMEQLEDSLPPKLKRLVGWNVEILKKLLQQIVAKRNASLNNKNADQQLSKLEKEIGRGMYVLDEVVEIIALPKFDTKSHKTQEKPNKIELPKEVVDELRFYVASIAALHRDNPFHNFEHASHVTMSVSKLLSRIVAPDEIMNQDESADAKKLASSLHDHTYGITSDPLTQFAVVLSALIHDVDHLGVSNFQLINEGHKLASLFKRKSVAEQNSIVLAWDKLMADGFVHLRRFIYQDSHELERFRQLMVNTVLATDIFDKELSTIRKNRWDAAFSKEATQSTNQDEEVHVNRKATIVIEHLIQASDVSHTMQHWHIYQKWNERLFAEMTVAFKAGRMANDPTVGWYQGELGFFDNYVIPLAKKLKECGVFGVSSDEYLNYALENRREWASKGKDVVANMVAQYYPERAEAEAKAEEAAKQAEEAAKQAVAKQAEEAAKQAVAAARPEQAPEKPISVQEPDKAAMPVTAS